MNRHHDHDGKAKTASAVDQSRYPEANEPGPEVDGRGVPTYQEVAQRAYQVWLDQGSPDGTADRNWFEAEQQLLRESTDRALVQNLHEAGGSVQA